MKKIFYFLFAVLLSCGVVACSEDDNNGTNTNTNTNTGTDTDVVNYADLLPGYWSVEVDYGVTVSIAFNYNGAGTIYYDNLIWNYEGVTAKGTYTLDASQIKASYNKVDVYMENGSTTYKGFTDNVAKQVSYTIKSCDENTLVLTYEDGSTMTLTKYKDL